MNLISDAVRFALYNRYPIENAPLQAYVSALIFSPINSLIREEFSKEEPIWVNLKPIIETSWSPCMQTLEGHGGWVNSVAFSPDGRQIVSGSGDGTVKVWDRESGACAQTLKGHGGWVPSVAFSPDGRQIVSGSGDGTVKVWDRESGACTQTLDGHGGWVNSVAFSPDGRQIVSGSGDGTVKVWDRESGVCAQTLEGHGVSDVVAVEKSNTSYLYVLTNRGWMNLAASQELSHLSMGPDANSRYTTDGEDNGHEHGYRYGYGLSADSRWVCRQEQSVLWLPPDYRPMSSAVRCFPSHAATTSDRLVESTVALGCRSGRVIILGLADRLPWKS